MQITLNTKIILIAGCLMLVACAGETNAQPESTAQQNDVEQQSTSLEQRCKQLSSETGEDYQVVSGKVINYGIVPPKPSECFEGDCSWLSETSAYYVMANIVGSEVKNEFYVYTEPEQRDELLKKNQDMLNGKDYAFCAMQLYNAEKSHKDRKVYRVDSIKSIQEIEHQKKPYHLDLLEHMKGSPAYPGLDKEYEKQLKDWEMQKGSEHGR